MADVTLRPATTTDQEYIVDLLSAADLPVADVPEFLESFSLFEVDGETIGAGALVQYRSDALLRSVVVEPGARGHGYGSICCRRLIDAGASEGIEGIYLLTTSAQAFFSELGFEAVERGQLPESIQDTRLCEELCPTSATAMRFRPATDRI